MSSRGDNEQRRALLTQAEELEWQSELESALSDLHSRLSHPRRRASDVALQPMLPQLGQIDLTSEVLDELAWRVADYLALSQGSAATPSTAVPAAPLPDVAQPAVPEGTALVIRLRRPLFSWKF